MKELGFKRKFSSLLGRTIYIVWILQWLWLCFLYVEWFFGTPVGKIITPDTVPSKQIASSSQLSNSMVLPQSALVGIAVIGGIALVIAAVYAVFKLYIPNIQRVTERAIEQTAKVSVERVVKSHIIPAEKKSMLTARGVFWLKVVVSLLPLMIVFAVSSSTMTVSREVAKAGALFLSAIAFLLVTAQYSLLSRK